MIEILDKIKTKLLNDLVFGVQITYFVQIRDGKRVLSEEIVTSNKNKALKVYNYLKKIRGRK